MGLLRLVDGRVGQRGVVEHDPDRRARRADRRAGHPAAPRDARLALVVLDDRAVLEHREVRRLLLGAAERLPVGLAEVVHEVVLVDDVPLEVHPPGPEHQVARRSST